MNTLRTFTLSILALLLSALAITTDAQPRQDALYIFRNDGTFNFFFFGDIDHIGYSKIDTLGVEQDDYVVQEVWAEDTLYRIPISAIDSVAFVTPENKVKADVFCPDKSIADYIVASDSVWWIVLAPNTPLSLIPNEGDKLLIDVSAPLIPDGFAGRVVGRELNDDGYLIVTEPLSVTEVYDRLVVKAAVASSNNSAAAKGVNGLFDGTEIDVPEETWDIPEFNRSGSLSYSIPVISDKVSVDISGTYSTSFKPTLTYRACIFIDYEHGLTTDIHSTCKSTQKTTWSFSGSLNGRAEIGFSKGTEDEDTKKTTGKGKNDNSEDKPSKGLSLGVGCGLYLEGSISGFELSNTHTRESVTEAVTVVKEPDILRLLDPLWIPEYKYRFNTKITKDESEPSVNGMHREGIMLLADNVSLATGIYFKMEAKLRLPLDKVQKWVPGRVYKFLKKYEDEAEPGKPKPNSISFGFKVGADLGGKLSLQAPWWLLFQDYELEESQPYYKQMNEGSKIGIYGYAKTYGTISFGSWSVGPSEEATAPILERYLVPDISGVTVSVDDEEPIRPYRTRFTAGISHDLMTLDHVGFIVYDKEKNEVAKKCDLPWFTESVFEEGVKYFRNGTYYNVIDELDPGKDEPKDYTVYPLVRLSTGREVLADKKKDFKLGPAAFVIEEREVHVMEEPLVNREYHVNVVPNMKTVEALSEADWIYEPYFDEDKNDLRITWEEMPDTTTVRQGIVRLKGYTFKTHELLVEDSIIVVQERPVLELSADSLVFGLEGGAKTLYIEKTNLKDLTVIAPPNEKWLKCSLQDNVITVTVDETKEEYNSAYVTVRGYTPMGSFVEKHFWVRQYENDDEVPDPNGIKKIFFKASIKASSDRPEDSFLPWLGGTVDGYEMDVVITRDNFTINTTVVDNSTLHVECSGSQAGPFGSTAEATLSFDIINFNKKKVDLATITNVKYTNNASVGSFFSAVNKINVSNVPLTNLSSKYIEAKGKLIQGVGFSNFLAVLTYSDGVEHISYEQDADNTAMIRISFNGNENDAWADVIDYDGYYGDDDDDNWAGGDDDDNWAEGGW